MSGMNSHNRQWYQPEQVVQLKGTLKFSEIKRDVPYQIFTPAGEISVEGQRLIRNAISRDIPDTFEWVWLKTHKTPSDPYIGTLPKRLANYLFKEQQHKMNRKLMESVGNLARTHTLTNTSVIFDITSHLNWDAGDFNDFGSCYWGDYENARFALIDEGGFALRLFTDKAELCACGDSACENTLPTLTGRARCWGVMYDTNLALFNAYGKPLYLMARILSLAMGLSYKKVEITNSNDVLYLNGDCVAIGKAESLDNLSCVELDMGNEYNNQIRCDNCEDGMPEDEAFMGADGNTYCESCYGDLHSVCEHCHDYHLNDNISEVMGSEYWCNGCIERYCYTCENCDGVVPPALQAEDDLCTECYANRPDDEPET